MTIRSQRPLVQSPTNPDSTSTLSPSLRKHHHEDYSDDDSDTEDCSSSDSESEAEDEKGSSTSSRSRMIIFVLIILLCVAAVAAVYFWNENRKGAGDSGPNVSTKSPSPTIKPTASISSGTPSSSSSASSSTAKPKPFLTGGATNESPPFSPTDSSSNPAPSASSTNDLSPSPTSSPSDSTSSIVSKELLNVLLKAHNDFRAIHQVDPLEWNDTLAESSNRWVDNCVYEHSGGKLLEGGYGENLLAVWSDALKEDSPVDGKSGVDAWNSEISMYTYDPPTGFTHETGHVTQTIWKGTKTVGCQYKNCLGLMKGGQWGSYLVCQYYPPGNWEGQYKENVLPPKED